MPKLSDGSIEGHFHLLILTVFLLIGIAGCWQVLTDNGIVSNPTLGEDCLRWARDLMMVAIGVFRGMPQPKSD
jgi:hypothetical protein